MDLDLTYPSNTNSKILWSIAHNDALIRLIKQLCNSRTEGIEQSDYIEIVSG